MHEEVKTNVIHADMLILQIETRVPVQLALEFFSHYVMATVLVFQNNEQRQPYWWRKPILWNVNAFPSFVPMNLHDWKHSIEKASLYEHAMYLRADSQTARAQFVVVWQLAESFVKPKNYTQVSNIIELLTEKK